MRQYIVRALESSTSATQNRTPTDLTRLVPKRTRVNTKLLPFSCNRPLSLSLRRARILSLANCRVIVACVNYLIASTLLISQPKQPVGHICCVRTNTTQLAPLQTAISLHCNSVMWLCVFEKGIFCPAHAN